MAMNLRTKTVQREQSDFDKFPKGFQAWKAQLANMGISVQRQGNVCFLNGNGYVNEGVSELSEAYCY